MHIRIKITLLFTLIMFLLLSLFCGFIYYFFYESRLENMKAHLTNQVLTTAGILDMDAELKIWLTGEAAPISKQFGKGGNNINEVYQILSQHILK